MRRPTMHVMLAIALGAAGSATLTAAPTPPRQQPRRRAATNADPAPERGGSIPSAAQRAQRPPGRTADPQAALQRYAQLYVNWSAATVVAVQHELAAISIGQARAQALQAAASYGHDSTLKASQVVNSGSVIAIGTGQGPAAGTW